jgi:hypothetical protein
MCRGQEDWRLWGVWKVILSDYDEWCKHLKGGSTPSTHIFWKMMIFWVDDDDDSSLFKFAFTSRERLYMLPSQCFCKQVRSDLDPFLSMKKIIFSLNHLSLSLSNLALWWLNWWVKILFHSHQVLFCFSLACTHL